MANKSVSFYDLDTDKIKTQLLKFDEIDTLLDDIGTLSDLSKSNTLVPDIFYNMTSSSTITANTNLLGDNYSSFKMSLKSVISTLKNDINTIEKDPEIIDLTQYNKLQVVAMDEPNPSPANTLLPLSSINVATYTPPKKEEKLPIIEEHRIVKTEEDDEPEEDDGYEVVPFVELPENSNEQDDESEEVDLSNLNPLDNKGNEFDFKNRKYIVKNPFKIIIDGEEIDVNPGEYDIIDIIYDINGNIVAISILVNGKKVWLQVINGKIVVPSIDPTGTYTLKDTITIVVNGQNVDITPGDYKILRIIYDQNGNVSAICIEYNGMKVWLYFDENGVVTKVEYIKDEQGIITITDGTFYIYDMYGNILGVFKPGKYYIYEVRYDQFGNVIAVRVSPDGEYEKWLYFKDCPDNVDYYLFDKDKEIKKDDKTKISFFAKNKSFLGALAILFVAMGAALVVKKRKKEKEKEEENEEKLETESLSEGSYLIYDVHEDEDGNVKEVKLNKTDDQDNEYWVEI